MKQCINGNSSETLDIQVKQNGNSSETFETSFHFRFKILKHYVVMPHRKK